MSLRGSLQSFSLPDILQLLALSSKTGALHVEAEQGAGIVWCTGGAVSYAAMAPDDVAGALVTAGLVDESIVVPLVATADPATPWGPTLVERGAISHDALAGFLSQRTEDALFQILLWDEGEFEFLADEEHAVGSVVNLPVDPLLVRIRERVAEWQSLRALVPLTGAAPHLVPDLPEGYHEVTLSSAEWRVVAAADGARLVGDIAAFVGESEDQVSLVLRDLVQSGLVVFAEPRAAAAAPVTEISLDEPPMADEDDGREPWSLRATESAPSWDAAPVVWDEPAPATRWDEPAPPPWGESAPPAWGPAEPEPDDWRSEPVAEQAPAEAVAFEQPAFEQPAFEQPAELRVTEERQPEPIAAFEPEPQPVETATSAWAPPSAADLVTEASSVPAVEWEPPVSVAEVAPTAAPETEWADPWATPVEAPAPEPVAPTAFHPADDVTVTIPAAEPVDRYRDRYAHLYDDVREDEAVDETQYDRTSADLPRRTMVDDDEESPAARRTRGDLPKIDRNVLLRMLSAVKDL
jgi:hypothetical protein